MLKIESLSKTFEQAGKTIHVLNNVELNVNKSDSIAILGSSGSGKSTLLSLLCGIDRADSGKMLLDGVDLCALGETQMTELRAKKIGIIFQQFHLLEHLNAFENVSLPLEIQGLEYDQKTKKALEEVGLAHRMDHFPGQLSGGEKQRVAIARSMVINPEILLADEPSGSLDEDTGQSVMNLIFNLVEKNKMTLLLVTHDQTLAKRCHRRYLLSHGKLNIMEDS